MTSTANNTTNNTPNHTANSPANPIDPNQVPKFSTMPDVATMDTSHINKEDTPFILVDGSYYLFRTFHALPTMTTSQGLHTNAVRGTLNALLKLMRRYQPIPMQRSHRTTPQTQQHTHHVNTHSDSHTHIMSIPILTGIR